MRQTWRRGSLALAGCLAAALVAAGQAGRVGEPLTDAQFAQLASASDLAEINLGRLAATRAASPDVKKFAEHMVTDHTKASKELLQIANKQGLKLAPTMDAKSQALANRLIGLKGAAFDEAYMKHQVMAHQTAVKAFKAQAQSGKDMELKSFATKNLPAMEKHLKKAREISGKLPGGTGGGSTGR